VNPVTLAIIASTPWILIPVITAIRSLNTKSLDDESGIPPEDPPLVSIVIPARNEARNIARCLSSALQSDYPRLEVVVVNDHSGDATADIARQIAATDERARVIDNPALPPEWFGKQWACQNGANVSTGEIILFSDADTTHSSDLVTRSVNAIDRRNAELFSVLGRQELGSFWERLIQPQVFGVMSVRYGGTDSVTNSSNASSKIANGQCLFVRRATYEALGGHSMVKNHVADDLMLAQRFFQNGKRVVLEEGMDQQSTRMYTSLSELIHGWGKNVFAGGRDAVMFGVIGKALFPLMLLSAPLFGVLPALVLLYAGLFSASEAVLLWALIAEGATLVWWLYLYVKMGVSPLYVLLHPLGGAMVFYIFLRATIRGSRVAWKGREYISA
jgi:glycosyltransferase involved in cell wall biosynthesis